MFVSLSVSVRLSRGWVVPFGMEIQRRPIAAALFGHYASQNEHDLPGFVLQVEQLSVPKELRDLRDCPGHA